MGSLVSLHAKCNKSRKISDCFDEYVSSLSRLKSLFNRKDLLAKAQLTSVRFRCFPHVNGTSRDIDMQQRSKSDTGENPGSQIWEHLNVVALKKTYYQSRTSSAVCVQHSIDSRNSAIHSAYRTLLRPSSLPEPRDPSLKVVRIEIHTIKKNSGTIKTGYLVMTTASREARVWPPSSQFTGGNAGFMRSQ